MGAIAHYQDFQYVTSLGSLTGLSDLILGFQSDQHARIVGSLNLPRFLTC